MDRDEAVWAFHVVIVRITAPSSAPVLACDDCKLMPSQLRPCRTQLHDDNSHDNWWFHARSNARPLCSHVEAAWAGTIARRDSSIHSSAAASWRLVGSALGQCSRSLSAQMATHCWWLRCGGCVDMPLLYMHTVLRGKCGAPSA